MATIAERHDAIAPAPLPTHEAPVADVPPKGARRRAVVAAVAGYAFDGVDIMVLALALPLILADWHITGLIAAIIFAAVFYLIAMLGAVMLRDGKELA